MAANVDKPKNADRAEVQKNQTALDNKLHPGIFTIQSEIPSSLQSDLNRKSDEKGAHTIQGNNRGHDVMSSQPQSTRAVKQSGARTGASAASQQHLEHTPAMKRKAVQDGQELHKKYVSKPLHNHSTEAVQRVQGAGNKVVTPCDKRVAGAGVKVVPAKYCDKPNVPLSENTPGVSRLDVSDVNIHVMDDRSVNNTSVTNNPVTNKSRAPGNPIGHDNANHNDVSKQEARRLKVKEREHARVARQNRRVVKRNDVPHDQSPARSAATRTSQPLAVSRTPREGHAYRITVEDTSNLKKGKQNNSTVLFNVGERTMKRIARQMSKDRNNYVVEQLPKQPKTYFDLALFTMCCCISPLGLVAVILSVLSNMSFGDGEMKKCRRYSKATLGLSIAGIITTILVAIAVIVTQFYTPLNVKLYGSSTDDENT